MSFEDLALEWGSGDRIPDDKLYEFLQSIRPSLAAAYENDKGEAVGTSMGKEVRRRCQRDLFWMCRYFLWETMPEGAGADIEDNLITEDPYRVVCDLFVKKDPSKPIKDQDEFKNRILLWPRGGMKSTIDICDTVQWILCFPQIRVFYITAEATLAEGFVGETKAHFKIHGGEPTLMNIFFPEFCVLEKDMGPVDQFRCPVYEAKHAGRKDPTVYATSVGKTQSGWHCEILKGDDPVSNTNSESVDQCIKVRKSWIKSRKMMRPFGFDDKIGTRYDDEDLYGEYLAKNIGEIKTTEGRNWTLMVNETTKTKILVGKAITIKPEVREQLRKEGKPATYNSAGEAGCELLIPLVWSYSRLLYEYGLDEVIFEGQMNQDPRPPSSTPFTREMLLQNTVHFKEMPLRGPISHTWDMAFSTKKHRDYTTGSSVIWNELGVAYVRNLVRDRFNPTDMAKAVVAMAVQDHPFIVGIEDAGGSRMIEPTIQAEAAKTGDPEVIAVLNRIDWVHVDTQKDAKKARMSTLHPWLTGGRLKLAKHLPYLEDAYKEIERCMLNTQHDDIPDVISRQLKYAPQILREIQKKGIESYSTIDLGWNSIYEDGADITTGRGYLLTMNPETGEMEWNAAPIANPISISIPKPEPILRSEAPEGMDCILGAGIFG